LEEGIHILNREELETGPRGDRRWVLLSKVPLRDTEGRIQGIVSVATDITAQKDAESRALAAQRALEEKNSQVEAELALACELQTELMTSSLQSVTSQLDTTAPYRPQMATLYEPSAHLAGDFFYVFPASPTTFGLLLCDVMGHGLKAALVTTLLRGLVTDLKAEAMRPHAALEQLNERLCNLLDRPSMPRFVTALFAKIDTVSGTIELANAGHPWPLLKPKGSAVGPICNASCDPALGLIRGAPYSGHHVQLTRGSQLFFFTDGLVEETNPAGEEFGIQRLAQALAGVDCADPTAGIAQIARCIREFSTQAEHRDDYCALLACF
jgi:sigma-B regulation protein RsbU (phosphoserine phosphatase)